MRKRSGIPYEAAIHARYQHLIYLRKHHPMEVAERFAHCYVGEVVISAIILAELE